MSRTDKAAVADRIVEKARVLGASLAGIAPVHSLKHSPSHEIYSKIGPNQGVGSRDFAEGVKPGEIVWPETAESALVIGLAHPEDQPHMDWWQEKEKDRESPGARILQDILQEMAAWVEKEFGMGAHLLPYHLEKGGIFFKDAAVLAGFGCIGRNNLLITPQYGPRVRAWALLLDEDLPPTGPAAFNPCLECDGPCRRVCPRKAFDRVAHASADLGMESLPGLDGCYDRELCRPETEKNVEDKEFIRLEGEEKPAWTIKFCRLCEFACPVGK